jgi:hypothetical protein
MIAMAKMMARKAAKLDLRNRVIRYLEIKWKGEFRETAYIQQLSKIL